MDIILKFPHWLDTKLLRIAMDEIGLLLLLLLLFFFHL